MSNGFGFGDIKAGTAVSRATREESTVVDQVGEAHGFIPRQALPTIQRKAKSGPDGPVGQFNLRAAVSDVNDFVDWCGKERLSYREGFRILMELKRKHVNK